MYFVNQVHLEAGCGGHVLHIVQEFPHIIDTCTGRRIHLNEIDTATAGYFQTTVTLTTRCRGNANMTIKTLGNDPGDCGFTDSASSREQIGVVQPVLIQRINQRLQDMFLTFQLLEGSRSVFPCKYLITHNGIVLVTPVQVDFQDRK